MQTITVSTVLPYICKYLNSVNCKEQVYLLRALYCIVKYSVK